MNKLEKYLKHRGISQKKFAEKIGSNPNNLSLLIRGKTVPTLRMAYEIEKKTGGLVTLYDWIPEDAKKNDGQTDDE